MSNVIEIPNRFIMIFFSEVEAKPSEVLKGTESTISCVVTGLTKKLDTVAWEKPNSGGAITNNVDGYKIDEGTYKSDDNSQTTILTVPTTATTADLVYTCIITSNEHKKTAEKTTVNLNTFSELICLLLESTGASVWDATNFI